MNSSLPNVHRKSLSSESLLRKAFGRRKEVRMMRPFFITKRPAMTKTEASEKKINFPVLVCAVFFFVVLNFSDNLDLLLKY